MRQVVHRPTGHVFLEVDDDLPISFEYGEDDDTFVIVHGGWRSDALVGPASEYDVRGSGEPLDGVIVDSDGGVVQMPNRGDPSHPWVQSDPAKRPRYVTPPSGLGTETLWVSYACRACNWGDWGPSVPERCPTCKGDVHVTGRVTVIEVKQW